MRFFDELLGRWYTCGNVRIKYGTSVRIKGERTETDGYAGCIGEVVGKEIGLYYLDRFVVDLGGMCVEVPPNDLELLSEPVKNESPSVYYRG